MINNIASPASFSIWNPIAALVVLLSVAVMVSPAVAGAVPSLEPDKDGVLFVIGDEDGTRAGYRGYGWSDIDEHTCVVGVDCHSKPFPSHLHAASAKTTWAASAVERCKITFGLSRPYQGVTLRLVRAGAETISVRLDDGPEVLVTKTMMKPVTFEHSAFGAYELELGLLGVGTHVLQLGVADDGEGNGRFGWDAIVLRMSDAEAADTADL